MNSVSGTALAAGGTGQNRQLALIRLRAWRFPARLAGTQAVLTIAAVLTAAVAAEPNEAARRSDGYFRIHVVDEQTGRGVPLVELATVNHVRFVTDSQGLIAIDEPAWTGQRIYFTVRSHGYEYPKDGFGNRGAALALQPGESATIKLKRLNLAERLYRITGEGIYRDSVLLNESVPLDKPLASGRVAGQDSAFAVRYRGKIFWFWGDTNRMSYPLGHYWMAGATSELPDQGGLDPEVGVNLRYFTDDEGFSRPVARLGVEQGMIWADTFMTVTDADNNERLVCHYAHMRSLEKTVGHGLAIFNDDTENFELLSELPMQDQWRFPAQAHPIRIEHDGRSYAYFGSVFPTVRVPAELDRFTDLNAYEYFTCLAPDSTPKDPRVLRDEDGQLQYRWTTHVLPMDESIERMLLNAGEISVQEARFSPLDVDLQQRLQLHRGSVCWNDYRQCWILIAGQLGGSSMLGEIYYSEAAQPTGPWLQAKKIVTHDRYTFYNPVQHRFFDQDGGRLIYFEGTYTHQFSGNEHPTPRYDYNQIMYRLDLADPRLRLPRG